MELRIIRSIFLCADGLDPKIQKFRERNDPLGKLIEPHITVGQGNAEQVKPMVDEANDLGIAETFSVNKLKIERIGDCGASNLLKTFYLD